MKPLENLHQYIEKINSILIKGNGYGTTTLPWYRGQSNASWDIIPSLYRSNFGSTGYFERESVRDFLLLSENNAQHSYSIETLIHMQHYGVPTRLVDWTESHLTALYFAVRNYKNQDNSAVFVFHPWELNEITLPFLEGFKEGDRTVPTSFDKRISEYLIDLESFDRSVSLELPIAIRPKRTNQRIRAQKGMFTLHGSKTQGLQELFDTINEKLGKVIPLDKIVIKGDCKLQILKELYSSGLTHSNLFPEQEGICKDISFRYSHDFTGLDSYEFGGF